MTISLAELSRLEQGASRRPRVAGAENLDRFAEFRNHYGGWTMNLFQFMKLHQTDNGFPEPTEEFQPTDAPPGSHEKVAVIVSRVESGFPLWHPLDRKDCTGIDATSLRLGFRGNK